MQWNFPIVSNAPTRLPDVGSHLGGLAQHFMKARQMQQQEAARAAQMEMAQKRMEMAQANQADSRAFRDRSFEANQEYRNRSFDANQDYRTKQLGLQEKRMNRPTGGPNADLQRKILEERLKKLKAGPSVDPLKQLKVKALQDLLGVNGGQTPDQAPPAATFQPQSNETTAPQDPNLIPTQTTTGQPEAPQAPPQSPMSNLTPEQRQAMALNLVSPGLGNPLLATDKASKFGKPATNRIEGKIIDTAEGVARLNNIQKSFKPEFQTYGGGAKGLWLKIKDKANLGNLSPQDTKYLTEFSQFKQDAIENINKYIKEVTGAQMSEAEATRLRQGMPDPGDTFWEGDSPTQFKAKMDNTVAQLKLSAARYNFLRSARFKASGIKGKVSLQKMRGIINKRAVEIRNQLRISNPGVDRKLIEQQAYRATAKEFGI